ncbi:hypothetical protein ACOSP7_022943 [Xanthoceras sorbifolium]|uniref:Glycosyltransferase n=1 Tax=Xanthoceras sorbifolium TaxID=99658 RepID=A0ABQ8HQ23_9ROSI|nr:hypothetical protein JRO89_XS08G0164800 [Xanthoceras sorbifolium]
MKPHVALLASPGMGHVIPVLELGKRLSTHHNLHVTVFVVACDNSLQQTSQLLNSTNHENLLDILLLRSGDISGLVDSDASIVTKILVMMRVSLSSLRSAISAMKCRPTALIVDLFGTEAMAVADEFNMLKYVFITTNAWYVATSIYAATVDKKVLDEHTNQKLPLKIPGCTPVRFEDTIEPLLYRNDAVFYWYIRLGMDMTTADGILVNTWEDLESKSLGALRDTKMLGRIAKAPVYPIGPLARPVGPPPVSRKDAVLDWLDKQPTESVIYVSFGSGGTLPAKQMIELAWGLEQSQQRFIWVVRPPSDHDASGSYLTADNGSAGFSDYLPDGFLKRTHNVGLVVPMWAPQAQILGHPSVGGFLSHCGWNSTLESIMNGVAMVAWPLYAEQKMNAAMLTEELRVAIRSKVWPSERTVERDEIEMMVRRIMVDKEGLAIRNRVKQMKNSAIKASSEGGSSYNSLSQVAVDCETSLQCLKAMAQGG